MKGRRRNGKKWSYENRKEKQTDNKTNMFWREILYPKLWIRLREQSHSFRKGDRPGVIWWSLLSVSSAGCLKRTLPWSHMLPVARSSFKFFHYHGISACTMTALSCETRIAFWCWNEGLATEPRSISHQGSLNRGKTVRHTVHWLVLPGTPGTVIQSFTSLADIFIAL